MKLYSINQSLNPALYLSMNVNRRLLIRAYGVSLFFIDLTKFACWHTSLQIKTHNQKDRSVTNSASGFGGGGEVLFCFCFCFFFLLYMYHVYLVFTWFRYGGATKRMQKAKWVFFCSKKSQHSTISTEISYRNQNNTFHFTSTSLRIFDSSHLFCFISSLFCCNTNIWNCKWNTCVKIMKNYVLMWQQSPKRILELKSRRSHILCAKCGFNCLIS